MFKTQTLTYVLLASAASVVVAGCQQYQTPINQPVPVAPVEEAEKVDTFRVQAVPTGGIIMRRVNDPDYEAPKREVDVLREYVATLTNDLKTLSQQSNALTGSVQQLQQADVKLVEERSVLLEILEEKFTEVEARITRATGENLASLETQKEQLGQAIAQIKSQGVRLAGVQKSVAQGDEIREQLLTALDTKFAELDSVDSNVTAGLTQLEQRQRMALEVQKAKEEAAKAAREERMIEELEFRKKLEDARRSQILAEEKALTEREQEFVMQLTKKRAVIEDKIAGAMRKIELLEKEEQRAREDQEKRLAEQANELQETLHDKIQRLEAAYAEKHKANLDAQKSLEEKLESRVQISQKDMDLAMQTPAFESSVEGLAEGVSFSETKFETTAAQRYAALKTSADQWINIQDYNVVLHADNARLEDIMKDMMAQAEPYAGPWDVKWKLKAEHQDVLDERFSLDAETEFRKFTSYLSNYMQSYRGFGLTFNLFEADRVLVITDQ